MTQQDGQQGQHSPPISSVPDGQQAASLLEAQAASQQQHPAGGAADTAAPPHLAPGAVLHGTCGWSDASLVRCGRFYPPSVKASSSSEEKLKHYSRLFATVEVDTSTYAIPRPDVTARWAQAAIPGFLFHVKAFGLFCSQGCQVSALPAEAKALLPPGQASTPQSYLRLSAMPPGVEAACWRRFHAALEPLYQAGKLGLVVFQFHLSFQPSQQNLQYILRCRAQLDARFRMAAEVRCRRWFTEPAWRQRLCEALSMQGITLVSADELAHETAQRDREQTGLPPGEVRQVLPIALEVTTPGCHYVRIHRRYGTTERLLPPEEIQAWAARLQQLAPRLDGPVYFLWGTDSADVPVVNARNLDAALPPALRCDWRQHCRSAAAAVPPMRGSIQSLLLKQQLQQQQQQQQQQRLEEQQEAAGKTCSLARDNMPPGCTAEAAVPQQQQRQHAGGAIPAQQQGAAPPLGTIQSLFQERVQRCQQPTQHGCPELASAFTDPAVAASAPPQIESSNPSSGRSPAPVQQPAGRHVVALEGGRKRGREATTAAPGPAGRRGSSGGGGILRFLRQQPPPAG